MTLTQNVTVQVPAMPAVPAMPPMPPMPMVEAQMAQAGAMHAAQAQVRELSRVIQAMANRREALARRLDRASGPEARALHAQISSLDGQLSATQAHLVDVSTRLGDVRTAVATMVPPPIQLRSFGPAHIIDPDAITAVFVLFSIGVIVPLSVGLARRLWRQPAPHLPRESDLISSPRLERLEQAVDSIAIEIERISEGQRFVTKLLSERSAQAKQANPGELSALNAPQNERHATTPH